jgi:hypothetical protein
MNTKNQIAFYLALAFALMLSASQVQAQKKYEGDIADYPVQVEDDDVAVPDMQEDPIENEQQQSLDVQVDEREVQDAVEKATLETEMALEQQEEDLAHDIEMSAEIERHDAEMETYLKSQ